MPIRTFTTGSGITQRPHVEISAPFGKDEFETIKRVLVRDFSFEGRIKETELWAQRTLTRAGLPSEAGKFYDLAGGGRGTIEHFVESRGFAEDTPEGYAARILQELCLVRTRLAQANPQEAVCSAFKLGVVVHELGMKFAFEKPALVGEKFLQAAREGGAARAKGVERRHREWYACAQGLQQSNPHLKKGVIAFRVARKFNAKLETVRAALRRMEKASRRKSR